MIARILLAAIALAASSGAAAGADPARYMDAKLMVESAAPKPGSTVLVGFSFTPRAGWHGYWSNPGDSGIAPTVRWTAPDGVSFGPLLHPAPTLISADGIDSFVHEGPHILLSRMTITSSLAAGTSIPVKADLSWAACTATQCVPLRATFTLDLIAGNGATGASSKLLQTAASKLPRSASGGSFSVENNRLELRLPQLSNLDTRNARFFPDESGTIDPTSERSSVDFGAVRISAILKGEAPKSLGGVVSDGRNAYRLSFQPAAPESKGAETQATRETETISQTAPPSIQKAAIPSAPSPAQPERRTNDVWIWFALLAGAAIAAGCIFARRR